MLKSTDVLFIAKPGRLMHDSFVEDGQRVLTLFYNEKEVTFDDPALIPFGERLLKETRFVAEHTRAWSEDGYAWETVSELLEALVEEGILERETEAPAAPSPPPTFEDRGSIANARAWTPESCITLSTEIFHLPVEPGNLESLMRGVRIAHPALDVGGRQVGEANVFPTELRLDLPTQRRACPYSGSRHEHELPMNVTGLEPVKKCWREVLHNLEVLKAEYFRLRPAATAGLTVLDLYVLASAILSIPTFMMFRAKDRTANGELPLEISSLFRVMDGTRITARDMLVTLSKQYGPDTVPEAARFFHYADRELLLVADRGVCAGPPAMIETFLEAVMRVAPEKAPRVTTEASRLGDVEPAMSYGIVACEIETITDQFWLRQGTIVDRLFAYVTALPTKSEFEQDLLTRLERMRDPEAVAYQFIEEDVSRPGVYRHFSTIIERCHELRGRPGHPISFPFPPDDPGPGPTTLHEISIAAAALRRLEEETFPRMATRQSECNAILGREPPSRVFSAQDMATAWGDISLRTVFSELGISI